MISPARQAANARCSSGPRSPEGKQRSSQNACKHGLTARDLVIRDDEREEFDLLLASCTEELYPQGARSKLEDERKAAGLQENSPKTVEEWEKQPQHLRPPSNSPSRSL